MRRRESLRNVACALVLAVTAGISAAAQERQPDRVQFLSADGKTTLVGYLYRPADMPSKAPAVVLMHGRAGPYSSLAHGVYDASTLSMRHRAWGERWAAQGYVALLVDSFGPRGYPAGFPRFSYDKRPEAVNEVTVRPLDAYGALAYLRKRADVAPDRVGLMGWSNGASATLAAMAADAVGKPANGFAAGIAFYPACKLRGRFDRGYRPAAPVRVFMGTADEEVSPRRCFNLVEKSRGAGGHISIRLYDGATHDFDDPGRKRQRVAANAAALEDATLRTERFFARYLKPAAR
jgi:carboxymethylenebutenolidase